ncbi:type II secretion system protein [bacterium]|nr:type II secretion system protein [bacterium]
MKTKKIFKSAFTLSETIMVLLIIGVIVSIVFSTLTPNISKTQIKAQLNVAQSLISQAIVQYQAENFCSGDLSTCDPFISENPDIEHVFEEMFRYKFKLEQDCGILLNQGCFAQENYTYPNETQFSNPDSHEDYYKIRLQNGIAIAIFVPNPKCQDNICARIIIDTNGPAPPNRLNQDTFEGIISKTQVRFDGAN